MVTDMPARQPEVLLIEDNPGDVRLMREALAQSGIGGELHVAADGIEGMAFLRDRASRRNGPLPDLILLDLNLPRKDGRDVLAEIKQDPVLRRIPVVVFTSSHAAEDIIRAYELRANCYVSKPIELERFMDVVKGVEGFWLGVARLLAD
jgi:CheY-like chemotaxis protein